MERVTKASPPDSAEARDATTFLALTAQESGVPDAAREAEAQRALQQDAAYVPALLVLGRNQASRGEKDAAINTFNQVLRRFPDFAPAQKELAALYLQDMRDPQKAYEMAANARKSMPGDPELAAIFGQASYHKKDYSRAAQLLQESNRKQPLNGEGLFYLGMALVETKQTVQGRELLERAVQTDLPEPLASEAAKVLRPLRKKGPVAPARSPHG
jgi:TolA-binding protein